MELKNAAALFSVLFHLLTCVYYAPITLADKGSHRNKNLNNSFSKNFGGSGPYTFDYLLGESDDLWSPADVIFVDYDIDEEMIREQLSDGKRVICYVNVGAWEDWRSDASRFPESVLGEDYDGWPGERWLDVRNLNVLLPIMRARFRVAAAKGCEGVDPDNMNGWSVDTGFPISFGQQLTYNMAIAEEIHIAGMMAGLKNDNEQAWELEAYNEFAVVESCAAYEECENFEAFIGNDKPVFAIEYTDIWDEDDFLNDVCPQVAETGISFILKDLDLHNDFIVTCADEGGCKPNIHRNKKKTPKKLRKYQAKSKPTIAKKLYRNLITKLKHFKGNNVAHLLPK